MSNHTPGPWHIADWSNDFGDDLFTIESRSKEVLRPGQSSIWPDGVRKHKIASTEDSSFDEETALANARLIAAAPELLGALEHLSSVYENIWVKMSDGEMALVKGALDLAEMAIAKAEGRS